MPSCLADIARGMESCFVYLQRDTRDLGTISINAEDHFEIHGNQGEPKLRLLADFDANGVLILADLQVVGGSGDGGQMSVEAGGELTFERVQMESGSLTFAGVVMPPRLKKPTYGPRFDPPEACKVVPRRCPKFVLSKKWCKRFPDPLKPPSTTLFKPI